MTAHAARGRPCSRRAERRRAPAPDLYEHPGISVEVLGALAILARWLASGLALIVTNVPDAVLAHAEEFLGSISTFFALLIGAATFIAGIQAILTWRSFPLAVAVELSPLLLAQVPAALPRVTPEPILIVASLLLVAVLIPLARGGSAVSHVRGYPLLVGIVLGFGLATKFTFLPMIGFVALVPGRLGKLLALGASGTGFILFTLPVAVDYMYMLGWLRDLAIHRGVNGGGDAGLSMQRPLSNVGSLAAVAPSLFAMAAVCVVTALVLSSTEAGPPASERTSIRTVSMVTGLVFCGQIFLTAKQPSGHYVMPSACCVRAGGRDAYCACSA